MKKICFLLIQYLLSFGENNRKKLLYIFMGKTDIKKKRFCLQKLQKKKAIKQSALICQNTVSDKINLIPVMYGIVFVT